MKQLLIVGFLLIGSLANAQNLAYVQLNGAVNENLGKIPEGMFVFEKNGSNMIDIPTDKKIEAHYLGNGIARKMYVFKEIYIYEDGLRINIEKPVIYKSIKRIDKHLKKQLKKGYITREKAEEELADFLDIAITIVSIPTNKFENALKNAKTSTDLIQLFKSVKIINI